MTIQKLLLLLSTIQKKKKRQDKEQFLPTMIYSLQYFVKEFNDLHSEVI